jgi:hypothetical protein
VKDSPVVVWNANAVLANGNELAFSSSLIALRLENKGLKKYILVSLTYMYDLAVNTTVTTIAGLIAKCLTITDMMFLIHVHKHTK